MIDWFEAWLLFLECFIMVLWFVTGAGGYKRGGFFFG
jgi:hypothetical protein